MATSRALSHVALPGPGVQLFASTRTEPRSRRPTDIALAVVAVVSLIILSALSRIGRNIDARMSELLATFPDVLDVVWLILLWTPIAWAAVLMIASVARRRLTLTRDLLAAGLTSLLVAFVAASLLSDHAWRGLRSLGDANGPPSFPPLALVIAVAAISTAAPHLTRPFRHFGRWIMLGQVIAASFLGASQLSGGLAAIAVGMLSASLVHLLVGSPGGRPTTARILLALRDLGVDAEVLDITTMHAHGVVRFDGHDASGPLSVKVYGRDAWDGQLLTSLWRALWYRGSHRTARLSRVELVEHEAFMLLFAERANVRVPTLVSAGSAGRGDALLVVRPDGVPLDDHPAAVDAAAVEGLWDELAKLHDTGIAIRWLDLDRLARQTDGRLGIADLSAASAIQAPTDVLRDRAQALAVATLFIGQDAAAAMFRRRHGDDALLEVVPFLQEAAMPTGVLGALRREEVELDHVRAETSALLGAPEPPLTKLRRVSGRSLVGVGLAIVAAYTLLGLIAHLDIQTFRAELADASWWWLAFALLLAQLPRFPSAVSTLGSVEQPVPLGPLTTLQFAITYVNLAIPSTAAQVAVNVRFFQRCGIRPATAVSAGVIDSVCGFVVQIVLFLSLFFLADIDVGFSTDVADLSGLATVALVVMGVLVVLVLAALLVPSVRRRVRGVIEEAWEALRVLRSPKKLVQLVGGNLAAQVLFGIALSTCVYAFGAQVSLGELVLINTVVSLFAGLLPVPGGIGVSEAGLTLGLVAAGMSAETAAAAALAYRFTSFYLPPLWGFPCYRWLVRRRYL